MQEGVCLCVADWYLFVMVCFPRLAGNYVVQYVLEQVPQYRHNIINIIAQSIIQLSRQKFSSNVVEKCLQLVSLFFFFSLLMTCAR